ncbi:MAG: cadmium-translocating P-type ATPase [Lachnospiraceae bacterium]|nr:cadmium-translocating P-type ATPase [Lachnospiraceae bacterium]
MKKNKKTLYGICITTCLFLTLLICNSFNIFVNVPSILLALIYIIPYGIIGYDIILKAIRNIKNGQVFDENFLMVIATIGAFGVKEYTEAVAVMLFYQVGELFQSYAVGKSRESIKDLMAICPEYANIEKDGVIEEVDPDDVEIGSIIVIKPGEKVPLDGIVIEGETMVNTAALTGESVPRRVKVGDEIISGCVNEQGMIKVKTTKEFDDSTVAKILELVENASSKKARTENFITRFAKYYTPVVTIGAILCAIIPPLLLGGRWKEWIETACTFLVISCPCALVISVPMGFFGGIGAASRKGILVKGSNYLEIAADLKTVVFDKTGTLTTGEFKVTQINIAQDNGIVKSEEDLLEIAAIGESYSNHPIASAIKDAFYTIDDIEVSRVANVVEIAGHGVSAEIDGKKAYIGNVKLMNNENINLKLDNEMNLNNSGTVVYIAYDNQYLGQIIISDVIKANASDSINKMRKAGINKTVMLTGDNNQVAEYVATQLSIDEVHSNLLPGDKVSKLEELLKQQKSKEKLAFVGDGINDAPVLTRADVGIAMGSFGSDAAIEAADIVIMDDDITKISEAIKIARKTITIVKQNIVFALGVKFLILILATVHIVGMWGGVFADVGVAVIAILNSMRMIYGKK